MWLAAGASNWPLAGKRSCKPGSQFSRCDSHFPTRRVHFDVNPGITGIRLASAIPLSRMAEFYSTPYGEICYISIPLTTDVRHPRREEPSHISNSAGRGDARAARTVNIARRNADRDPTSPTLSPFRIDGHDCRGRYRRMTNRPAHQAGFPCRLSAFPSNSRMLQLESQA
jgi:hypothetical protein